MSQCNGAMTFSTQHNDIQHNELNCESHNDIQHNELNCESQYNRHSA
jgi:hypothetical protein